MKKRIYEILEVARPGDKVSSATDIFIMTLVLCNVLAVVLESVQELQARFGQMFLWFEVVSIAIFTIEYLLRIWSCTSDKQYSSPLYGRLRFALTPLALIDLLAIAPFYIPFALPDLRVVRAMRLIRILRILKFGRYSEAFRLLGRVLHGKRQELAATFTILVALLIIAASLMYEAERLVQPDEFRSIPAAMWWAIVTLTTVGYGDVFPVTDTGRMLAAMIAVLGIGMVALPTGIIGAGFVETFQTRKATPPLCPHCGKTIEAFD